MYHRIVASKVRSTFAQISAGNWEPMLDGMAPEFRYRFYGEHALSGERQTLHALRRWWERSVRLFPNPTFEVEEVVVADEGESAFMHYLLKPVVRRTFLRHVCADMRHAEDEIRDSNLDWTIFRPPALTSKTATGTYRTAIDRNLPHGFTVSRADLAACMLATLADPATVHRHVAIAS